MGSFKKFFLGRVSPLVIDPEEIEAAPRPEEKEREIKEARIQLVGELLRVGRKAHEIRHELAGSALRIVAGEK